jgi:hypothetical protein
MKPTADARRAQNEALRAMNPARKLEIAHSLVEGARLLKRAGLASAHPEWDAARLDREVARVFRRARS